MADNSNIIDASRHFRRGLETVEVRRQARRDGEAALTGLEACKLSPDDRE